MMKMSIKSYNVENHNEEIAKNPEHHMGGLELYIGYVLALFQGLVI
jgi:hypothetical protein